MRLENPPLPRWKRNDCTINARGSRYHQIWLWEVGYDEITSDTMDSDLEEVVVECILGTTIFRECAYSKNFRGLNLVSMLASSKI